MVRQTAVLQRIGFAFNRRKLFKIKGIYNVVKHGRRIEEIVKATGSKVQDGETFVNPPPEPWKLPDEILPDFRWNIPPPPIETHSDYHKKPIYHLSNQIGFTEGVDQACILTKSQKFEGLPPQITNMLDKYSIKDQDAMVQRLIMQSQKWDPTKKKLPKRRDIEKLNWVFRREFGIPDTRSASILLNNFVRICQSMSGQFPALVTERRLLYKPSVETQYNFKGETIQIKAVNECLIAGRRPLPPFGDRDLIKASVDHKVLNMHPVLPTIDLMKVNKYKECNKGAFKESLEIDCSYPQTVFRIMGQGHNQEPRQAFNVMTTFAVAIAEARNRYGITSGPLPEPITIQNINCNHHKFNYLCFQLNTMDFDSEDGIKNFVWVDTNNTLFEKIKTQPWKEENREYKPTKYEDYNSSIFKKFLAIYLYGYV